MAIMRMDNVAIVVEDLDAAISFFQVMGMDVEGRGSVEGDWVDRAVGSDGVRSEIAMMATPDGSGRVELTKYHLPASIRGEVPSPNTVGMHRIMFAVDDLEATIVRLEAHGARLLGSIAQFEDSYRLCYIRGPDRIIVALAEEIA